MPEFSQQSYPRPPQHRRFADQLVEYLSESGACADPTLNQSKVSGEPAVFILQLQDEPDRALCVFNITMNNAVSESNPTMRFSLCFRGAPHDQLGPEDDAADAFDLLHDMQDFHLTATQSVLSCRRIINDPQLSDSNHRWHSIDTYEAVLATPI